MPLLTRKEAIDYLRISERAMCALTAEGKIAYIQYRANANMLFRQEDLDAFIQSSRVPTRDEKLAKFQLPGGDTYRRKRKRA